MHPIQQTSWIEKYVGLRFEDKGRGPDSFDCWGLVRWIYMHELKLVLPDYLDKYETVLDESGVESAVSAGRVSGWDRVDRPQNMDLVLFKIFGRPLHVGIVAGKDYFLHCPEDDFSRRERLSDRKWKNRIEGFYRKA